MTTLTELMKSEIPFTDKAYLKYIIDFAVQSELLLKGKQSEGVTKQMMHSFQTRFNISGLTLLQIIDPQPYQSGIFKGLTIYDFPTAISITRTLFEIYSNANWLIIRGCTQEERDLFYDIWELHGYLDRQKIQKSRGPLLSQRAKQQYREEEVIIERIRNEIKKNKKFSTYSQKEQNRLLMREWALIGIKQRAYSTEFSKNQVDHIYKYTSVYAHAEPLSIFQSSSNESPQHSQNMLFFPILYSCYIFTFQTRLFLSQFPELKQQQSHEVIDVAYLYLREILKRNAERRK